MGVAATAILGRAEDASHAMAKDFLDFATMRN
jgi:hypothetical protein